MASLNCGQVRQAAVGEVACGDGHLVVEGDGYVLVAVSDGLGHGPAAREATLRLLACVEEHASQPPLAILEACHRRLAGTQGAAATILRLDRAQGQAIHAGVGNVEARIIGPDRVYRVTNMPGVLGERVRKFLTESFPYQPGDLVVVYTDGISDRFELPPEQRQRDPQALAYQLAHGYGKHHDDQLLLVLREDR